MTAGTVTMDFDAARKQRHRLTKTATFKLGGETFHVRKEVRPDVIARAEELSDDTSARETIELFDDTIVAFIEPKDKAHERYRKVRERENDPIGVFDLITVCRWLVEQYTVRPTEQSGSSSRGPGRTTTRSTGSSRSKAST